MQTDQNVEQSPTPSKLSWLKIVSWSLLLTSGTFLGWVVAESARRNREPTDPREVLTVDQPVTPAEFVWPSEGVADFSLTDQDGNTVTRDDLLGKPWAVGFVFTRCAGQCLNLTAGLKDMQDQLKDTDVRLVSLSVDPKFDTPEVLKNYATNFGADPEKWLHLTGDQDEIYQLIQKSFLMPVQEETGENRKPGFEVLHSPNLLHVNARGQVVGKFNGLVEEERNELVEALKTEAEEIANKGPIITGPARLPGVGSFELTERSGRTITEEDLHGQPWAVCFVFTRCAGPCLNITAKMAQLQGRVADDDVRLVTITVDPAHDKPPVLQNYADNFGADPEKWLFLTGEKEYVYPLLRSAFRQGVAEHTGEARQPGYEIFHTTDVLHIDAEGNIVKRYNGASDAEMMELAFALRDEAERLRLNPVSPTKPSEPAKPAIAEKP